MRSLILLALVVGFISGAVAGAAVGLLLDDDNDPADAARSIQAAVTDDLAQRVSDQIAAALDARDQTPSPSGDDSPIAAAFARTAPSVVVIDAEGPEQTRDDGVRFVPAALASGIVLDNRGHVVTAAHVLDGVERIDIILPDGDRRPASLIASDAPFTDIAVIRVDNPDGLTPAPFGSNADLRPGQAVLAIGNILLGSDIAVTVGVVSDPDTTFFRQRYIQQHLIQTDAALNHGNSGGALVAFDGSVVGMTTTIARETLDGDFVDGVGFALQIDTVLQIARTIVDAGSYPRASFGVVDERLLTPAAAQQLDLDVDRGAFIIELARDSVFADAGVRPGDVIRAVDGITISADMPYINAIADLQPGVPVDIIIHRDGRDQRLTAAPALRQP